MEEVISGQEGCSLKFYSYFREGNETEGSIKMKKREKMVIAILMSMALLTGCGSQAAAPEKADAVEENTVESTQENTEEEQQNDPEITITAVTVFDSGTAIAQGMEKMKELLEEKTDGKVTMEIFPSGTTGGEKEQAEALVLGEVDMAAFGTLPISIYAPEYSFFDSPFVFRDREHFMNVWNSELGDGMRESMLENNGLKTIGVMGRGYRHITSNTPINSIDDIAKLTIRTPESALFTDTFGALGATCVPIALTELFTSLQTGVVNASEGPFDQIVTNKLYEVQDYITLSKYYYSISMWQMNADFFDGLPEEYQNAVMEAAQEATEYATALGGQNEEELKKVCEDAGCTILEMEDMEPYLEKVQGVMDRFFEEKWPVTSAEEIASY